MAFTETGFKRSMKITITRTGNDGTVVSTIYDGQEAFGVFPAIADNDTFRRLERNGVDGDWDLRLIGFKNYVLSEVGQTVYDLIDWDNNTIISINTYDIKIMAVAGTGGQEIISIVYKDGMLASTNETVNVYFDTINKTGVQLQIANNYYSGTYLMDQADGDIREITNPTISPTTSVNGIYNITIDTVNEWGA